MSVSIIARCVPTEEQLLVADMVTRSDPSNINATVVGPDYMVRRRIEPSVKVKCDDSDTVLPILSEVRLIKHVHYP